MGQARSGVVKLVVAQSGGVVAQGSHGPQLCGLGGVESLDQRADGEVAAVYQQRVRVPGLLPVNGSFQPGVAAGLPAVRPGLGQKVGVEVMGEEDGGLEAGAGRQRLRLWEGEDGQQQGQEEGTEFFHGQGLLIYALVFGLYMIWHLL